MSSDVSPAGGPLGQIRSLFTPGLQKRVKDALKGVSSAIPQKSTVIQERLEKSERLDELAAGIPGMQNMPKTGLEVKVKGAAIIAASTKAKESIEKEFPPEGIGARHVRTIAKGDASAEKVSKLFPKK
jgi:hypothetical protein